MRLMTLPYPRGTMRLMTLPYPAGTMRLMDPHIPSRYYAPHGSSHIPGLHHPEVHLSHPGLHHPEVHLSHTRLHHPEVHNGAHTRVTPPWGTQRCTYPGGKQA